MRKNRITLPGRPLPLGVKVDKDGAQFSILSRNATSVSLILFESTEPNSKFEEIKFNPLLNKTGDIWHIWISGIKQRQLYGYRIDGPYNPSLGHRFNRNKLLLDPYANAVTGNFKWDLSDARGYDMNSPLRDLSFSKKDSAPGAPKCIIMNTDLDWLDKSLKKPLDETIIYELHVKGFTYHKSSGVDKRGTFKGIIEMIPYFKELGITAVELMPIQEFDENENPNINPFTGERLQNYWGYSTLSFFAPKSMYSSSGSMGEQVTECKEMIMSLHNAGIEVILDVVFNHTAELDHLGPTLCFRGIDNSIYYILEEDKRFYKNYSGCGNTINCNNPLVRGFILDCLKYWVVEMDVDGFRFDLASILGRDENGSILSNPPLIEIIEEDPILRDTKIIAEAWDAAGAYQVGDFPGRWAEWNGRYRDDVRRFWRGDMNTVGFFATRLMGSSDLYSKIEKSPLHSINFITSHDGFTLNDLVSFNLKHNEANGENNIDGDNNNFSSNYGLEGNEAPPDIEKIRNRQIKNFLATLFLSQGVPMLLAGDEFRRSQQGNNNAYCQDNEMSWIDWSLKEKHNDIFRFCSEIIRFRKDHHILRRSSLFTGEITGDRSAPDVTWHGIKEGQPDWNIDSNFISCVINGDYVNGNKTRDNDIFMAFNASSRDYLCEIPESPSGSKWLQVIDTYNVYPDDIYPKGGYKPLKSYKYLVKNKSTVVFISEK